MKKNRLRAGLGRNGRAIITVEAEIAPLRASALKQVSMAAFELVRYAMVYRDVAGAQPRQARVSIVDLARGATPEAGWAVTEVDRLWDELRARARAFAADSGPGVAELDLPLRRHVHAIDELLSRALDDMSGVAHGATTIFNGRQVGQDDEVARGRAQMEDSTRALRARLQDVVMRAQALMDAAGSVEASA